MYFLIYSRQQNVTALFVLFWSKCIHKIYPCRISFQLFIWSLNTCDPQGHAVAMAAFWRFPSNFVWFASIKPRWCLDKQQPRSFGKSHPNRINFFFYDRAASRVLFLFAEEDGPHRLVGCVRQLFFFPRAHSDPASPRQVGRRVCAKVVSVEWAPLLGAHSCLLGYLVYLSVYCCTRLKHR